MIDNPIEKLCASPHRWLFVTAITVVISLVSFLPQVDVYLDARSERSDLEEQLELANKMGEQLPRYEEVNAKTEAELENLKRNEVEPGQTPALRSWLVNAARQTGCQVRKIDFSRSSRSSWTKTGNPLEPKTKANNKKTPFELQKYPIAFSVTGAPEEIQALLKSLDDDYRVKHTSNLDIKPVGRNSQQIQVDLTLWYFALVKPEKIG